MRINNYKSIDKKRLFYCYSPNLYSFLAKEKDIHSISFNYNKEEDKEYYVFVKTKELDIALEEWENIEMERGG